MKNSNRILLKMKYLETKYNWKKASHSFFLRPFFFKLKQEDVLKFIPAGNYMFKVSNGNTRTRCKICSKLTTRIPERRLISA